MKLPDILPPAYRGKAFRFSYDLIISLTVSLPGTGRRQRAKDIHIPIRVWANVTGKLPERPSSGPRSDAFLQSLIVYEATTFSALSSKTRKADPSRPGSQREQRSNLARTRNPAILSNLFESTLPIC